MNNEFKKSKNGKYTVYTLESATGGGTSAGSVASVSMPMGGVRKRGDNLIAQEEKKDAPKPRNFVAKNAKMGGAGQHKDKKKAEKQGDVKHKKPFAESVLEVFGNDKETGTTHKGGVVTKTAQGIKHTKTNYDDGHGEQGRKSTGKESPYKQTPILDKDADMDEDHEIQMASSELQSIAKDSVNLLSLVRKYSEKDGLDAWQQSKITKAADYLNAVLQSVSGEKTSLEGVGVPFRGVGGAFNRGDDERHDLDIPRPQIWGLKINGKVWNKNGQDVTFTSKEQALKARQSILAKRPELEVGLITKGSASESNNVEESPEDRTSYQVAKILSDKGIKYDPAHEGDLIKAIGMVLVKELNMNPKQARHLISYDEDFLGDTMGELRGMENAGGDAYMESLAQKLAEKIPANAPTEVWVQDFQKADPNKYHQFKNKTPAKKAQMAVAASYAAKNPSKK
jgi:hypothetical protein